MKYYSPEGNLEVWDTKPKDYYTEAEWAELHPAPEPPEPTTEEKIAALDAQYNREKTELANYFLEATIMGDTELQTELKAEIKQLNADYDEKRRELEGE